MCRNVYDDVKYNGYVYIFHGEVERNIQPKNHTLLMLVERYYYPIPTGYL